MLQLRIYFPRIIVGYIAILSFFLFSNLSAEQRYVTTNYRCLCKLINILLICVIHVGKYYYYYLDYLHIYIITAISHIACVC